MTEIRGTSGKSIAEVVAEVKADMERDAADFDGRPLTGLNVGTQFGNQGAAISALAGMIGRLDECVAALERAPTDALQQLVAEEVARVLSPPCQDHSAAGTREEDWSSGITHPKHGDAVVTLEVSVTAAELEAGWPTPLRTDPVMLQEFALSVIAALNEVQGDNGMAYQPTVRIVSKRRAGA